jgi:uncharacterized protein (DUF1330 family)
MHVENGMSASTRYSLTVFDLSGCTPALCALVRVSSDVRPHRMDGFSLTKEQRSTQEILVTAYIIAGYDIVDPEGYEGYVPGVVPLLQKHGAEILVAEYDAQPLEGEKRSVYVVLRFESEAAALGWYNDPAYEPVRKIRLGSSNNNVVLANQFVPPSS